jgi:hypothetical protein
MWSKLKEKLKEQKTELTSLVDKEFGKARDKIELKVTKCKADSGVTYCRDCEDFKVCTIKRFEP